MDFRMKKQCLLFIVLVFLFSTGALSAQNFEVKFKVLKGADLAKTLCFPANWDSDYSYVIGFIRNLDKKNALVSLSFWHNQNKYFATSGYHEIGWVDGNNSAPRFFLIPIGLRNDPLPRPSDDFSYSIKVLQTK